MFLRLPAKNGAMKSGIVPANLSGSLRMAAQGGVPPVKWSTFWDNFIPRYGGLRDDSQTGKGRRHSYEASAG